MTKTRLVARLLINQGRGWLAFNDRLVNNRRSLKVWGWGLADYEEAKRLLEDLGCRVELVQFKKYSSRIDRQSLQTRLHVTE